MKKKNVLNAVTGYGFMLPSFVLLLLFVLIPIVVAFYWSTLKYNGMNPGTFVGLNNFKEIFKDPNFIRALKNTLRFMLTSVPLQTSCSLGVAALLAHNLRNRFGEFIRGALFIPVLCSAALIGGIMQYIFAADDGSLANVLLNFLGVDKVNWLGNAKVAPWVVIGISVWKSLGYFVVIFYAAIMDIPVNLFEAAEIDGANKWQQFWHITLPNIKSVLFMVITVGTIWSFQFFDLAYVMTAGGPSFSNVSIVYLIYNKAFKDFRLGYACAIGVLLFFLMLIVNLIQRLLMKEDD